MRIVETHHHLWDLQNHYYPWLTDRVLPKTYGDYGAIRKDYLIGDFFADIGALPVVKSVHVNGGYDSRHPVRETEWLQAVADDRAVSRGFPHGIVADIDLLSDKAQETLEGHCRFANMRGVRQILSGIVTDPANHPDITQNEAWHRNIGLLPAFDLSFELQLHPSQMAMLAGVADRHPGLPIIVCHTGMPAGYPTGDLDLWRSGMRQLAERENVSVKVSGLGMFDTNWTAEGIRPVVLETIDIFGTDRVMFGTNFPVDSLFSDYATIWRAYDAITASFGEAERDAMFAGNAERIYRL